MTKIITILLAFVAIAGGAFGEGTKEEDARAIVRDYYDTIIRGYETGDIELYLSVFSDDLVAMPPDSPLVIGKEQYRARSQALFGPSVTVKVTIELQEALMAGDWIFARCHADHSITSKESGTTTTLHSKVLEVLARQEDGSWKCHTVCFNAERPPTVTGGKD